MAQISLNMDDTNFEDINIHGCDKKEIAKKVKGLKWKNLTNCQSAKLEIGNITITFFARTINEPPDFD